MIRAGPIHVTKGVHLLLHLATGAHEMPGGHQHAAVLEAVLYLPVAVVGTLALVQEGAQRHWPACRRLLEGLLAADLCTRLGLLLLGFSAVVHLALVPEHSAEPLTQLLFVLYGLGALGAAGWALLHPVGRLAAASLLLGALFAYCVYLAAGLEQADPLGLATKAVELGALALLTASVLRMDAGHHLEQVATSTTSHQGGSK